MTSSVNKEPQFLTPQGHFLNGVISSFAMIAVCQPLDTTCTRLIARKGFPPLRVLYRGTTPSVISIVPFQSSIFLTYGLISKHLFKKDPIHLTTKEKIVSAAASATIASPVGALSARVKIFSQLNDTSTTQTIRQIVSKMGPRGLFRGYSPVLLRGIGLSSTLFGLTDLFSEKTHTLLPPSLKQRKSISQTIGPVAAGSIFGIVSLPIYVIQVRMMGDLGNKYTSIRQTAKVLLKEEGISSFLKGIVIRPIRIGISIWVMSVAKRKMPSYFPESLFEQKIRDDGVVPKRK